MDHERPRHEADAAVSLPLHLDRRGTGPGEGHGRGGGSSPGEPSLSTGRIAGYLSLGDGAANGNGRPRGPRSSRPLAAGASVSAPLPKWGRGRPDEEEGGGDEEDDDDGWFVGGRSPTETPAGERTGESPDRTRRGPTPAAQGGPHRQDHNQQEGHNQHEHRPRQEEGRAVADPKPQPPPSGPMRRRHLQRELARAVFAHPSALAAYCVDAYATARRLKAGRIAAAASSPKGDRDHLDCGGGGRGELIPLRLVSAALGRGAYYASVPPPVLLESSRLALVLALEAAGAASAVASSAASAALGTASSAGHLAADVLTSVGPGDVISAVLSAQRSAMDRTGDALVGGMVSVASAAGSVSGAALERLSRQGLKLAKSRKGGRRRGRRGEGNGGSDVAGSRLFRRLHRMDDVSRLVTYSEGAGRDAFGKTAKKRAQRMMHYQVSFRPFFATIQPADCGGSGRRRVRRTVSFERSPADGSSRDGSSGGGGCDSAVLDLLDDDSSRSDDGSSVSGGSSLFMCTPTSFPPTPASRLRHIERGSRFTENVVFLARDQLRVETNLVHGTDEQTRLMSRALLDGARLAVFDAAGLPRGVTLSCGQHIATRDPTAGHHGQGVGGPHGGQPPAPSNASVRGMIPVMRNSHVYFEISVSPPQHPRQGGGPHQQQQHRQAPSGVALGVGLSTLEMPLDALVGAWRGSAGLCSGGQVLHEGRWRAPPPSGGGDASADYAYGPDSTVGCLVYVDDGVPSDPPGPPGGTAATARVTFSVDGAVVPRLDGGGGGGGGGGGPTLSLPVPRPHELFPTVTLHGPPGCSVMCRFSGEDILAGSWDEVGAPPGASVYAVDGSVVLEAGRDGDGGGGDSPPGGDRCGGVDGEVYLDADGGEGEAYPLESVDL